MNFYIFQKFKNKRSIILYLFSIFIFQFGFLSLPNIARTNTSEKNIISIDYLDQLPRGDYILGPGDIINIKVSREIKNLDNTSSIDESGTITLSRLKRIYVAGLTINELSQLLNTKYKEFVINPDIEIRISKYRPVRIFIDGEIENPGLYLLSGSLNPQSYSLRTFQSDDKRDDKLNNFLPIDQVKDNSNSRLNDYFPTLFDAIRVAGGITFFTDLSNIEITRQENLSNGGGRKKTEIDFAKVITEGDITKNIRIYDGDVIKLKKSKKPFSAQLKRAIKTNLNPRFIQVFVYGRVENPGIKSVTKSSSLLDAIDLAGGTKVLKGKLSFTRFNQDGSIDKRKFSIPRNSAKRGSYTNPILKPGDILFVGKSKLNVATEILNETTAPFLGIYSIQRLFE